MTWLIETKQQLLKCQMQTWCPYKFGFWSLIYCEQIDLNLSFSPNIQPATETFLLTLHSWEKKIHTQTNKQMRNRWAYLVIEKSANESRMSYAQVTDPGQWKLWTCRRWLMLLECDIWYNRMLGGTGCSNKIISVVNILKEQRAYLSIQS